MVERQGQPLMPNSMPSVELTRNVSDANMTNDQQPAIIPNSEAIGDASKLDEITEELMASDEAHEVDNPLDNGENEVTEDANDEIEPPALEDDNSVDEEAEERSMPLHQ